MKYPTSIYAVFDDEGRFDRAYVSYKWANKRVSLIGGTIRTYIDENNREAIEIAEFITRKDDV